METTFWGPSGWKLLHTLAYLYPNDNSRIAPYHSETYKLFYNHLKYILPCKYCRQSIKNFMNTLPIEPSIKSKVALTKWMFGIHNKVNNKLRKQRYCTYPNPSIITVDNNYSKLLGEIVINARRKHINPLTAFAYLGNDFIGSIIYNYRGHVISCQDNQKVKEINKHYDDFFQLLAKISYLALQELIYRTQDNIIDNELVEKVMKYYRENPLNEILKGEDDRMIKHKFNDRLNKNADELEMWYYKLYCIITDKNCTPKKQFDGYFKEHIVGTCNNSQPSATIKTCRLNPIGDMGKKSSGLRFNNKTIKKSISRVL